MKIERGFTRKLNIGNYESLDIWTTRSIDIPDDTPIKEQRLKSEAIWQECFSEVMEKINSFKGQKEGFDPVKICNIIDNLSKNGNIGSIEDFENLTPQESMVTKSVDKLRKRSERQENKEIIVGLVEEEAQNKHIRDISKEDVNKKL